MERMEKQKKVYVSERLLIVAGIVFLLSAILLSMGGTPTLWFTAKSVYGLGVLLLFFNL